MIITRLTNFPLTYHSNVVASLSLTHVQAHSRTGFVLPTHMVSRLQTVIIRENPDW